MLTIGLTGGIGCGKSTAAAAFEALGVPVIDADRIAHQLTQPGQTMLKQVIELFGDQYLSADGTLDRAALRALVFSDSSSRRQLESLLHPAIRTEMQQRVQALDTPYCILVIPLLLESQQQGLCDRILVIDCSLATQGSRVLQRPGLNQAQFDAIVHAQCTREHRLAAADDIINNDSDDMEALKAQILTLHDQYQKMRKNA